MELQSEKYVQTLDEEASLELDHNDKSLFVFSDFTSDAFDHCRRVRLCDVHFYSDKQLATLIPFHPEKI